MNNKNPNPKDPRARRTRERLHRALISLTLERGYEAVTVRDVVERSGVGRSTFYLHFGSLEELLLPDRNRVWFRRGGAPFAFTHYLIEHTGENRRLWRALVGRKGGIAIQRHFLEGLQEVMREDVERVARKLPANVREAVSHYLAGAFADLLFWWLDHPSGLSAADVDRIFQNLTQRALNL